jgi:peptidoglycan hydrolase-like protein with peptidoglycan-binding domain
MALQVLKKGDSGNQVIILQSLLNRTGAMLNPDGDFGSGTVDGVKYAQDIARMPVTGIANETLQSWLETQPEPFAQLDTNGVAFIAREETGGLGYYNMITKWPHFPGEKSGITIGVGYDLRFNSKDDFLKVWGNLLSTDIVNELINDIGQPGTKERAKALQQIGIEIPFKAAWKTFVNKTLPRFYNDTMAVYPSLEYLPGLCRSALVSLVFNRGGSVNGSNRAEMKNIQTILYEAAKYYPDKINMKSKLAEIEEQFLSMKRLWSPDSGLIKRRQGEANLWRNGLAKW